MERKRSSASSLTRKQRSRPATGVRDRSVPRKTPLRRRWTDFRQSTELPPGCPSFVGDLEFREIASVRLYGRDSTIVHQGDPARYAYILRRGLVQLTSLLSNGKSFMDLMGPGSIFGVPWILTGLPYGFGVTACEECELDRVEATLLVSYMERNSRAAMEILRTLCKQEIQIVTHMLSLTSRMPSGDRLISALHDLSRICGVPGESGTRIAVPLTVQMLADKIGCSRQWASKLMGELETQGKLKRKGSWITLTDRGARSARS